MLDTETRKQIASTILQQLGGYRFIAMTGAKNLVCLENGGLGMRLPIGNWHACRITLNANDAYDLIFERLNFQRHVVSKTQAITNVYVDQLREVFERETGLRISLGTLGRLQAEVLRGI